MMRKLTSLIFVCLFLGPMQSLMALNTSVEMINGIPIVCVNGAPYHINGWCGTGVDLFNQTNEEIKARMDSVKSMGFDICEIMVHWRLVEARRDSFDFSRYDDLMDYADSIGLWVRLTIDAMTAPPWFADSLYPDAVFYTFDPDSQQHSGDMWGRLAIPGYASVPIFYHPEYYSEVDDFITALVERYINHPSLFSWYLALFGSGEYNYPGGSLYGVAGFADYSDYTANLYGPSPPYPLNMFSQPSPDMRQEWIEWTLFRMEKKRETLDHFAFLVKSIDTTHILGTSPGATPLWGEWLNGYIAEVVGIDYLYLIKHPHIDLIVDAPQVSTDFLDVVNGECSFIPYIGEATIRTSYRWDKPLLRDSERQSNFLSPSVDGKITIWAEYLKSLGVDFLWWEYPETTNVSGRWTPSEKEKIKSTLDISNLPHIVRYTESDFTFIDLPFEGGKYYADNTFNLLYAMKQMKAFMDAGLPFDCVSEDEILQNPDILESYKAIGLLFPDMYNLLASDSLKNIISNYSGAIWYGDPLDGYNYWQSGYMDTIYLDSLRVFYDTHNLARHHYNGHFIYITGNKPYIFILSRESDYSGPIGINIKGWDLSDGDTIFVEYNSGASYFATISDGVATLSINLTPQEPYLFVLKSFIGIEEQNEEDLPASFMLFQNYPNPFNQATSIKYSLAKDCQVELKIYNISGQLVKTLVDEHQKAGTHIVDWNGTNDEAESVSSGIYFYQLKSKEYTGVKRCVVLK